MDQQQILDALACGGKTINQITAEVGFPARNLVHAMTEKGMLQKTGKALDQITGRKVYVFSLGAGHHEIDHIMLNLGSRPDGI